ncbi:hypothetical protein QSJ19_04455 [Gordonia sp. ABSL11-1]|uniref:hypothetical protein n=1 Tax=Gordonia sp. ABSL11-1 TaxID=3053924 RepID=UPI0025727E7B|nr:hypothetical protein [Gordonia sp. ABSL11-1]MDL9944846.1 hypothetical protein [Gordonia sp. ABSL11-1]
MADQFGGSGVSATPRSPARLTTRGRRRVTIAVGVIVVALVVSMIGIVAVFRSRSVPDDGQRAAVLSATTSAVTALMTFGPDLDRAGRDEVQARLTGPLLADYRSRGPDVVLPGAVAAGATMSVRVVGAAVNAYADDQSQVLVFADQAIRLPGAVATAGAGDPDGNGERAPTARWATMRNVEGNWRLADLQPVGDVTR